MFGVGFSEIIVIAIVAIIVVGPGRLPEFMRKAGKLFVQTRRFTNEARSTFDGVIRKAEQEMDEEKREALKEYLKIKHELAVDTKITLEDDHHHNLHNHHDHNGSGAPHYEDQIHPSEAHGSEAHAGHNAALTADIHHDHPHIQPKAQEFMVEEPLIPTSPEPFPNPMPNLNEKKGG